ncbi:MAG: valine--tRNA ligase [Patescibacteria group bacterium]|nr:valine--tRNA ligase [Patescibacteria group bacterium]
MESAYEPKKYVSDIYGRWEASGFFNPDKLPGARTKKYSVAIPPPNITGSLHMGHALNNTIQDIAVRFYRMLGYKTLWVPGTDHAGIATQNVVEKELAKQGLSRHQLGREKFVERVWEWKEKYGDLIIDQLKKLGCSCDWSRLRFTLDDGYVKAVQTAFVHYFKKGYIYRGPRIVNWCPRCSTAISDIEIKYQEEKAKLWYIKYPLEKDSQKFLIVATTRPETMLGDSAIAVSPKDERYKNLIGQKVILPIVNRPIPIVSHRLVDLAFGTGALKITPAHDAVDWQIGQENNLPIINVIGPDGKMSKEAGEYAGLRTKEAREKILAKLKEQNLLVKEEDYPHQISLCDRCGTAVEPQVSTQWFVKMDKLATPAYKAVSVNKIKIIPERYQKVYLTWLTNIKDWCVSRQLWWGHRVPAWFCKNDNSKFIVSIDKPKACPFCKNCELKQSDDVLDTWFSSALWPFAILGWPEKTADLKGYYPTSFLSTARDILYLWVARMVFSGLEFINKIPFKDVYIHSTILNLEGRRMSKSLGTGIDPLVLIEKYGTDATRLGLIMQINRDQQAIKFDERTVLASRNFINKLWNVSRFISGQKEKMAHPEAEIKIKPITLADQWILSRFSFLEESIQNRITKYEFGEAARELYDFTWHELADWYLEMSKSQIDNEKTRENTINCLRFILNNLLKLWHPFIPFVTEEIYKQINPEQNDLLIVTLWPKTSKNLFNISAEKKIETLKQIITEIRNYKASQKIPLNQAIDYKIDDKIKLDSTLKGLAEKLAKVKIYE